MPIPNGFKSHYAHLLADAASASEKTPLSIELITKWNRELLEPFYPDLAGKFRSEPRTLEFPHRPNGRGEWTDVLTDTTPVREMHGHLMEAFELFEQVRSSNFASAEEAAGPVAWPAAVTMRCQPFEAGSTLIAFTVLVTAAQRAGWEINRMDWDDKLVRARLYWAVRSGRPATIKPFAEHLAGYMTKAGN
ncbi:MAG TPA: hypothetical protein VFN18_04140 [Solirubrobacterales bacterium]|nr:hypothetical protein [Solirubrobacterales bacterium]